MVQPVRRGARRTLARLGAVGVLAVAALIVSAGPAAAATSSCAVQLFFTSCNTGAVAAHPYGHYVKYEVGGGVACARADWQVIDVGNGQIVAFGHVGSGRTSGQVNGLYGNYKVRVFNSCWPAFGRIWNQYP
jgi:hypothetical protein